MKKLALIVLSVLMFHQTNLLAESSAVFRWKDACVGVVTGEFSKCRGDDCRALVFSAGPCATRDCGAMLTQNADNCESEDCRVYVEWLQVSSSSDYDSNGGDRERLLAKPGITQNCQALILGDATMCTVASEEDRMEEQDNLLSEEALMQQGGKGKSMILFGFSQEDFNKAALEKNIPVRKMMRLRMKAVERYQTEHTHPLVEDNLEPVAEVIAAATTDGSPPPPSYSAVVVERTSTAGAEACVMTAKEPVDYIALQAEWQKILMREGIKNWEQYTVTPEGIFLDPYGRKLEKLCEYAMYPIVLQ